MSTAEHTLPQGRPPDAPNTPDAPPLSAEERQAIEALAQRYDDKRAACVEALKLVQQQHRWVCDAHLGEVAQLLGMTVDELDGVATYYNLVYRRPVGRHIILVCDSVSCWLMGCDALRAALSRRLAVVEGQTSADGRFTLLPIVCLGHCDHAPALMIDRDLHGDVGVEQLPALLEAYP